MPYSAIERRSAADAVSDQLNINIMPDDRRVTAWLNARERGDDPAEAVDNHETVFAAQLEHGNVDPPDLPFAVLGGDDDDAHAECNCGASNQSTGTPGARPGAKGSGDALRDETPDLTFAVLGNDDE